MACVVKLRKKKKNLTPGSCLGVEKWEIKQVGGAVFLAPFKPEPW
jgi:hypothetical protein